jgi:type II secretory pathway pseudopilin PulG
VTLSALGASERQTQHRKQRQAESQLRGLATALEAYKIDHGGLAPNLPAVTVPGSVVPPGWAEQFFWPPPAWPPRPGAVVFLLRTALVPTYTRIRYITELDPWGHPFLVAISGDRKSYTLICTGRDGRLDMEPVQASRHLVIFPASEYDHDIVLADDRFLMFPEGDAP